MAEGIGSHHFAIGIDEACDQISGVFSKVTASQPRFQKDGGTYAEDLALQNIQARVRMVLSYLMAQLVPWTRGGSGFMLVLASGNIDEGLRGYMTKYDCSSADLNPIGSINKVDLKNFLKHFARAAYLPVFEEIANAKPTAELRPDEGDKK